MSALRISRERASKRGQAHGELRALPSRESQARLAELLLACPEWIVNVPAHVLLKWARGIAEWRARKLLAMVDVREVRTVGELTERQRRLLARALGGER